MSADQLRTLVDALSRAIVGELKNHPGTPQTMACAALAIVYLMACDTTGIPRAKASEMLAMAITDLDPGPALS